MRNLPPEYLPVGSVVTTPIKETFDLATHFAIVTNQIGWDGLPIVIANSPYKGGPSLVTWTEFTGGRPYKAAFYPGTIPPAQVLQNAYSMFDSQYDLALWNCEHFAYACHGLPPASRQVRAVIAVAAVTGLALLLSRAA